MSKLFARFGGKKDKQSPQGHARSSSTPLSTSSNGASNPSSPGIARRASKQLLNFHLSSPSNGERPSPVRGLSKRSTPSAAPKIELDFGAGMAREAGLHATGVGLQSPIDGVFDASAAGEAVNGNGQASEVVGKAEVELLRRTRYTWTQVETAWAIAGEELKVIGLKTPDLFRDLEDPTTAQTTSETNRLLAIFTISTSPSPASLLSSFPSLADYYPPVSFIPQTDEWYLNDFKTHVGWVKDPHVLVRFLKTVTRQTEHPQVPSGKADSVLPEWYTRFRILERTSNYPTDAFTRILSPLIPTAQYDALCTAFDIGAVVTANAAFNGCAAREVFCAGLGWWIMGSGLGVGREAEGEAEGWRRVYRAWEQARDAVYHLFKAWIRDQERTGTLPLLVLEHVKDYQTRLENPSTEETVDVETVLQCELCCQLPPNVSSSSYSPTPEDLVEGLLLAVENVDEKARTEAHGAAKWRRRSGAGQTSETEDDNTTLVEIVRAIRDAQYPHIKTAHERSASSALPQTPTAKDGDSIYRPFRTPSSSSFMHESGTPTGPSTPGVDTAATPPRTPFSPISALTTPGAEVQSGERTRDSANWTDFAETGFGETTTVPKPFVLGDAFKELRIREEKGDRSGVHSRAVPELGLGRPRNSARSKAPPGNYTLETYDTVSMGSAFIEFERDARLVGASHGWPHFQVLHLDSETVRRMNLCSRDLLVSIKLAEAELPKPESPPIPAESNQLPVSAPLHTPPLALNTNAMSSSAALADSEKKNRRRSFFPSFSGSSSKNRKVSSPSISSPLESPLPAVVERREPLPTVQIANVHEPPSTPIQIQARQSSKLSPGDASNPASSRSRASSVNRKPVPALEANDLLVPSSSEPRVSMGDSFVTAHEETQFSPRPVADAGDLPIVSSHATSDLLDGAEEIMTADSASLSVTDTSDVAKSPHRRRRSNAPSPASVGVVGGDLAETPVLAKRLDDSVVEANEGASAVPKDTFVKAPPVIQDDAVSENTFTHDASLASSDGDAPKGTASTNAQPEDSPNAPVSLGAVL